jgi:plastocyanin
MEKQRIRCASTPFAFAVAGLLGLFVGLLPSDVAAETYVVVMRINDATGDFAYQPERLEIEPGDTVIWVQADPDNEHNVAAYPSRIPKGAEPFASPLMTVPGETWSYTFTVAGSYYLHCHPHEAVMRGLVVVGRESAPDELRESEPGEMSHDHHDDQEH